MISKRNSKIEEEQREMTERNSKIEEEEREMKLTCDQARGPSPLARHSCRQRAPNVFSPL